MAKKKHKTTPTQPPKADPNVLVLQVPLNVAMGHQQNLIRHTIHQHPAQRRLNTRQAQLQRAFKDW
jgi:predicted transposase YdaD